LKSQIYNPTRFNDTANRFLNKDHLLQPVINLMIPSYKSFQITATKNTNPVQLLRRITNDEAET